MNISSGEESARTLATWLVRNRFHSQAEVMGSTVDAGNATSVWFAGAVAGISAYPWRGIFFPESCLFGNRRIPSQAGALGLFAGLLVYGLSSKSRFTVVSATSSSAAVPGAPTLSVVGTDSALRVALAAGFVIAIGTAFPAARLRATCNFISMPVLRGFRD